MTQEYSSSMAYDSHFRVQRSQHRQPIPGPWQANVTPYQQPLWPQNVYSTQSDSSLTGFSTPSSPQAQAFEIDHTRSLSRSPEYYTKQSWPNDVIYTTVISSSSSHPASSPRYSSSLPSRAASSAPPGSATRKGAAAKSRPSSTRPSPERQQPPKIEVPEDGKIGFVMEPMVGRSSTAPVPFTPPPMAVPLRATQASDDMRKMMAVFRLNPFALQNGDSRRSGSVSSSDSSSTGVDSSESSPSQFEAKPLEDEPLMFEFQVQLDDPELLVPESDRERLVEEKMHSGALVDSPLSSSPVASLETHDNSLHSFPPEFELHRAPYDSPENGRTQSVWETCEYLNSSLESSVTWSRQSTSLNYSDSYAQKSPKYQQHSQTTAQLEAASIQSYTSHREGYSDALQMYQGISRSGTESPLAENSSHQMAAPPRHLSIDNSELFSQGVRQANPKSMSLNLIPIQTGGYYPVVGGGMAEDSSATSSHRRWSLPSEPTSGITVLATHAMNHTHGARVVMPAHSTSTFVAPLMR